MLLARWHHTQGLCLPRLGEQRSSADSTDFRFPQRFVTVVCFCVGPVIYFSQNSATAIQTQTGKSKTAEDQHGRLHCLEHYLHLPAQFALPEQMWSMWSLVGHFCHQVAYISSLWHFPFIRGKWRTIHLMITPMMTMNLVNLQVLLRFHQLTLQQVNNGCIWHSLQDSNLNSFFSIRINFWSSTQCDICFSTDSHLIPTQKYSSCKRSSLLQPNPG